MWINGKLFGYRYGLKFRNPFKIEDRHPEAGHSYLFLIKTQSKGFAFHSLYGAFGGWCKK